VDWGRSASFGSSRKSLNSSNLFAYGNGSRSASEIMEDWRQSTMELCSN
jgi:hypothetical protein